MNPCVYCGAGWPDPVLDIDHANDCPFETNLWPVLLSDLYPHGFCCARCGDAFSEGDHYTTIAIEDDDGHTDEANVEVTCLSCAAAELVLS